MAKTDSKIRTRQQKRAVWIKGKNARQAVIAITIVLGLLAGWTMLASSGALDPLFRQKRKQIDTISTQSFNSNSPSKEYVYAGSRLVATDEPSLTCTYAINPSSRNFPACGGTGSVSVTAGTGCNWTAASNTTWIHIVSGSSGSGNGAVSYSVDPNSGVSRAGTMAIANQTFTATQSAAGGGGSGPGTVFDFEPDNRTEIAFYRNGLWGVLKSSQAYSSGSSQFFSWGAANLEPVYGDFDGDGKADIGYLDKPGGGIQNYSILLSTNNYGFGEGEPLFVSAGWSSLGDLPVVGDFDGDHKADPGIWRSSTGQWILPTSSSCYTNNIFSQWGQSDDIPIVCDLDGDGKADMGFYRNGLWGFLKSSTGYGSQFFSWGGVGLQPVVGDFDGDGKADIGYIVPPSGGQSAAYAILLSSRGYSFATGQPLFVPAGFPSLYDTPVVGDWDGDGKTDPAIWRASTGVWIIPLSTSQYTSFLFSQWGQAGDIAMPSKTTQY